MRRQKQLPKMAAPPQLKVQLAKTLGTADPDVLALEAASVFCVDRLLERAEAARLRREAAGISDRVELKQPPRPVFDTQLVGKQLEILWPYKERWQDDKDLGPPDREERVRSFVLNTALLRDGGGVFGVGWGKGPCASARCNRMGKGCLTLESQAVATLWGLEPLRWGEL